MATTRVVLHDTSDVEIVQGAGHELHGELAVFTASVLQGITFTGPTGAGEHRTASPRNSMLETTRFQGSSTTALKEGSDEVCDVHSGTYLPEVVQLSTRTCHEADVQRVRSTRSQGPRGEITVREGYLTLGFALP